MEIRKDPEEFINFLTDFTSNDIPVYAFFSDFHFSSSEDVDNFRIKKDLSLFSKEEKLIKILDILTEYTKVYLVGDIFELWQGDYGYIPFFKKLLYPSLIYEKRLEKIFQRYSNFYNFFKTNLNKNKIVYIVGNHDIYLKEKYNLNIQQKIVLKNQGLIFQVSHGFEYDDVYKEYYEQNDFNFTGPKFITEIYGVLENLSKKNKNLKEIFKSIASKISDDTPIINNAFKFLSQSKKINGVIIGHTHKTKIIKKFNKQKGKEDFYINCGCSVEEEYHPSNLIDFVIIADIPEDKFYYSKFYYTIQFDCFSNEFIIS